MTPAMFLFVWAFLFPAWVCFYRREWLVGLYEPRLDAQERKSRAAEPDVIEHYQMGGSVLLVLPVLVTLLAIFN